LTNYFKGSILSSPGKQSGLLRDISYRSSPTPSLQPFDRRFQARLSSSPMSSPRALSPAFLNSHSRHSSLSSQLVSGGNILEEYTAPWDVVRWTKLKKITAQAFSETGKRNFGKPTFLTASASIVLGTTKGILLVFDFHQNLQTVIGPGTKGNSFEVFERSVLTDGCSGRGWVHHINSSGS
jgi:hypothetical protein